VRGAGDHRLAEGAPVPGGGTHRRKTGQLPGTTAARTGRAVALRTAPDGDETSPPGSGKGTRVRRVERATPKSTQPRPRENPGPASRPGSVEAVDGTAGDAAAVEHRPRGPAGPKQGHCWNSSIRTEADGS
jgi:hypothetical protein